MLPVPVVTAVAGLAALCVLLLPLGAVLLRAVERFLGRRSSLHPLERMLLAFYASGGLLFVLASIPLPIFGLPLVVGLLGLGIVVYAFVAWREGFRGARAAGRFLRSGPGAAVLVGTLALLVLEMTAGQVLLPNGVDGSVDSLFINLLVSNHTSAWTLAPYAQSGVIYPQGVTVWMALPVLLFGWPIVASPVVVPPLFLSLAVPSAFCLGERLRWLRAGRIPWNGLLFAAYFGLLASWPRLYVGGSYDFVSAFPLFLTILGLSYPFLNVPSRGWKEVLAFGGLLGVTAALSPSAGLALAAITFAGVLLVHHRRLAALARWTTQWLVWVGMASLFLVRSITGVVLWFHYPQHVMTQSGNLPLAPEPVQPLYGPNLAEVDPFYPWKWKVSPILGLSVELQVLLAVGVILLAVCIVFPRTSLSRYLAPDSMRYLAAALLAVFAEAGVLIAANLASNSLSGIQSVTNLWEASILLFTVYGLVALLPLAATINAFFANRPHSGESPGSARPEPDSLRPGRSMGRDRARRTQRTTALLVILVVGIPLASGAVATGTVVPGLLTNDIKAQANVTSGDLAALEWAGSHLTSCSRAVMAQGSAAQFLPEYGPAQILFPSYPIPTNLSYFIAVSNLTLGLYGSSTKAALLNLGATEVFVTGQTTNAEKAFVPAPLLRSSDFRLLFEDQDAFIFEFLPVTSVSGCAPT